MYQSGSKLGRYEQGQKYMENLTMRSKKLSADTRNNINSLPKLYAKVDELNRKLASSRLNYNINGEEELRSTPSQELDDGGSNLGSSRSSLKKDEIYLKEHKKALLKKTMVVSQCLDEGLKQRLEGLKYGSSSSLMTDPAESARRYSMIDLEYAERHKKSPRETFNGGSSGGDNDETISENNDEIFSSTVDSNEYLASPVSKDEFLPFNHRRLSKSRMSEFACNLSKEGQYALLKSLEDKLYNEIEANRPDLVDKLPSRGRNELAPRRKSLISEDQIEKRDTIVMQQIETIMKIMDEMRDGEKRKQTLHPPGTSTKKQIHFSDSSEYFGESGDAVRRVEREKNSASSSAFKSVKHEVNVLPSHRRHRKSIASSDILDSFASASQPSSDKVAHLLAVYSQLKKHLD